MDYMPVATQADGPEQARHLIRRVKVTCGTMNFRIECSPAFHYARQEHKTSLRQGVPAQAIEHLGEQGLQRSLAPGSVGRNVQRLLRRLRS